MDKYQKSVDAHEARSKTTMPSRPSADATRSKSRSRVGKLGSGQTAGTQSRDATAVVHVPRSKSAARPAAAKRSTSTSRQHSRQRMRPVPELPQTMPSDWLPLPLPKVDASRAAAFKERRSLSALRRAGSASATAASSRPESRASTQVEPWQTVTGRVKCVVVSAFVHVGVHDSVRLWLRVAIVYRAAN